jgi:hypothetical protein
MKKSIILQAFSLLIIFNFFSCNRKESAKPIDFGINSVMDKHYSQVSNFSTSLKLDYKDAIVEVYDGLMSEKFEPAILKTKLDSTTLYYEKFSTEYNAIVDKTKFRLDSLLMVQKMPKKEELKIEDIKVKLDMLSTKIILYYTNSRLIATEYNELIKIRKECKSKVEAGEIYFASTSCQKEFIKHAMKANGYGKKMDEIKSFIENFK